MIKFKELKNEGLRDFNDICERYEELLEYMLKRIFNEYNKNNNIEFDFYDVVRGNYNSFLN